MTTCFAWCRIPARKLPRVIRRRRSTGVLVAIGLADLVLVPGRLPLAERPVPSGPLVVELAERRKGPRAVDRGRAALPSAA